MVSKFDVYDIFVMKEAGKISCVFPVQNHHEKVLTEEITKKLSIYNLTAFPVAVQAFVFDDGRVEIFTANKL